MVIVWSLQMFLFVSWPINAINRVYGALPSLFSSSAVPEKSKHIRVYTKTGDKGMKYVVVGIWSPEFFVFGCNLIIILWN